MDLAEEGRKRRPFDQRCEALGVIFDLSNSSQFECKVANTDSRIEEIAAEVQRLIGSGSITQINAQKLRGRMQFAESQIFGRTGNRCINCLKDFSCRRRSKMCDRDATFLKFFLSLLKSDAPRIISKRLPESIVMITDACYERDARDWSCGLGAIFVDSANGVKQYFSC